MIAAWLRRGALLAALSIVLPPWLEGCAASRAPAGWHIDVGFAADDLVGPLKLASEQFPEARFFSFGFGDSRYLHARHPAFPNMLAALWPVRRQRVLARIAALFRRVHL